MMAIPSQENQMNSSFSNILPAPELKQEVEKQENNFKKLTQNQKDTPDEV